MNKAVFTLFTAAGLAAANAAATRLPDWGLASKEAEIATQLVEKQKSKHTYPVGSDTPKKIKKYYGQKKLTRKQRRNRK